jgi:hypothetical protein
MLGAAADDPRCIAWIDRSFLFDELRVAIDRVER